MKIFSNDKELPYICKDSGKQYNTWTGLSLYVTNKLKITHKDFYDNIFNGKKIKCHFCKNDGRFISIKNGYSNLCKNKECIKKSRQTFTIDGIMYYKSCTKKEAKKILQEKIKENQYKNKKHSDKYTEKELKENSNRCIDFWLKKGYNEEDAKEKVSTYQKNNAKNHSFKLKNDDFYLKEFKQKLKTCIEYWLKKGYNTDEAKQKLKERQTTFSKEICIEKYGEVEGLKRWQERQDLWLTTMNNKSDEEKALINKKRLHNFSGYSKVSQEIFWKLYNRFKNNDIYFEELNREFILYNTELKKHYKPDYIDFTNKKIIEYNGDYWHCNPKTYESNYYHKLKKEYAKDIWKYDNIKINYFKKLGYDVLIIWEKDFKQNSDNIIKQCIEFIKE